MGHIKKGIIAVSIFDAPYFLIDIKDVFKPWKVKPSVFFRKGLALLGLSLLPGKKHSLLLRYHPIIILILTYKKNLNRTLIKNIITLMINLLLSDLERPKIDNYNLTLWEKKSEELSTHSKRLNTQILYIKCEI